jgi:hypothetical protein
MLLNKSLGFYLQDYKGLRENQGRRVDFQKTRGLFNKTTREGVSTIANERPRSDPVGERSS